MNKPIKDYTLGEVKELCDNSQCETCIFYTVGDATFVCRLRMSAPVGWNLSEPPRWTPEEVERAKAVKVLWPELKGLYRSDETDNVYVDALNENDVIVACVDKERFPSIQPGETVTLEEIINSQ